MFDVQRCRMCGEPTYSVQDHKCQQQRFSEAFYKMEDRIKELEEELKIAKSEQCPHDYSLLKAMEPVYSKALDRVYVLEKAIIANCSLCRLMKCKTCPTWEHYEKAMEKHGA